MAEQSSLRSELDSTRNSRERNVTTPIASSAVLEMLGWPLLVIAAAVVMCMCLAPEIAHFWPNSIRVAFVIFALMSLALLNLRKSAWLRVLCTLPVKRSAIARLIWLLAVLPGTLAVGLAAAEAAGYGKVSGADALLAPLEMFMILAALALAMPILPLEIPFVPAEMRSTFWGSLAVIAYLLAGKYLQLPSVWKMDTSGCVILSILLTCTIASFWNRDLLLSSLSSANVSKHPRKVFRTRTSFTSRRLARATSGMLPAAWVLFVTSLWLWRGVFRGFAAGEPQVNTIDRFWSILLFTVIFRLDMNLGNRLRVYKTLPVSRRGMFLEINKRNLAFSVILIIALCLGWKVFSWTGLAFLLLAVLFWFGATLVCVGWSLVGWDAVGTAPFCIALLAAWLWPKVAYESAYDVAPLVLGANGPWYLQRLALIDLGLVSLGLGLQCFVLVCNRVAFRKRPEK